MQDRRGVLELTVLADGGGLAIALDRLAVDAERGQRLAAEQVAELPADVDQLGEIVLVLSGEGGWRSRRPRRRA